MSIMSQTSSEQVKETDTPETCSQVTKWVCTGSVSTLPKLLHSLSLYPNSL